MSDRSKVISYGNALLAVGLVVMAIGGIIAIAALNMNTEVSLSFVGGAGNVADTIAIENSHLMQKQMMALVVGLAIALAGAIGIAGGTIVRAIAETGRDG